jgi:ABC-type branched-subunit amino acid transport system substrate-binding protein
MRRRKALASLLVAGALGAGVLVGCGDDEAATTGTGGDTAAAEGGEGVGALKLGVLVPLTGDLTDFGGPGVQAANLGRDQVNTAAQEAGVDLNVTLVPEDTQTDPQAAQEAATKLIETDDVSAIAGPWASSETIPVAENVTVDAGVPIVSPSATDPAISELEDDNLVFRTAPSDVLQGRVLAKVMADQIGADASVVTANRNDAYGVALVEQFTQAWEAGGGTVVRNVAYNPEAASLNSEAQQIAQGNPDAWVFVDFPETWSKMGPALVRTGNWDPAKTFTTDGLRSAKLPGTAGRKATEGMRGTVPTSTGAPAGEAFDALWTQETGDPRGTYDAQNFDAIVLLSLAATRAGSSDPADIAEALAEVSAPGGTKYTYEELPEALKAAAAGEDVDYEGASGPLDLDENGDPTASNYSTWSYKGGKLVDSKEIIPGAAE